MKRGVLSILFLVVLLLFFTHFVKAANCGGTIACSCGDTLNESWTMTSNLSCTGSGLIIGNHSLVLDCAGHSLTGDGGSSDYGIDNAGEYDNITIRNCTIINFSRGINNLNSENGTIEYNHINLTIYGLYMLGCSNNSLYDNYLLNNTVTGIYLLNSHLNRANNNIINNNSIGIDLSSSNGNSIINNTLNYNTNNGIQISSSNNTINNNTANSNTNNGFQASGMNNTFLDNIITLNTYGIVIADTSSTLKNNIVNNNTYGLKISDSGFMNTVNNNTLNHNKKYGLYLLAAINNTISNNNINNNSIGIFSYGSSITTTNNTFSNNKLEDNFNSVFDNDQNSVYTGNKFFSKNNIVLNPTLDRTISPNVEKSFITYFNYINGTACSNITVNNISTEPNENISYSLDGCNLTINFTASKIGLYSMVLNITDDLSNTIKQRIYFGNQSTLNYYFRPDLNVSHGQPKGSRDAKSLIFEAPSTSEEISFCFEWVQVTTDSISENITGISRVININTSFWYEFLGNASSYFGVQKNATYTNEIDYGKKIANTAGYTWINEDLDFNYWIYNLTDWYWLSLKLKGNQPFWKTNETNLSYANITYLYTETPEIKSITNEEVNVISATSLSNDLTNSTIVLDGIGTTNITVQMSNTSLNYSVFLDNIRCNNTNCNFSQLNGEVNISVVLGSEHNISIANQQVEPSASIILNSSLGTNTTNEDLGCYATILDDNNDDMNVTVRWYKNNTLNLTIDYNNSYANGTLFNANLTSSNTTLGDTWKCSIRLFDSTYYSTWLNSSDLTIITIANNEEDNSGSGGTTADVDTSNDEEDEEEPENNNIIFNYQDLTNTSITIDLNQTIQINLENNSYNITYLTREGNQVTFNINGIESTFKLGLPRAVDLDNDGIFDALLKISSFSGNKVNLYLEKYNIQTTNEQTTNKSKSNLSWLLVIIAVILALTLLLAYKKHKKTYKKRFKTKKKHIKKKK